MQTETNLLTKKKKILILLSYLGLILIFLFYTKFKIPCIFKKLIHIPCPSCGMTRAFKSILTLNLKNAISYNILSIPLFLTLIIIFITDLIDIILKKQYLDKIIHLIIKYYYLIIILLLINWIINIYKYIN